MTALAGLVAAGDKDARRRLRADVQATFDSEDAADRLQAARALEWLDDTDREAAAALLNDEDIPVRLAALDAVQRGDAFAVPGVLVALREPATIGAAIGAAERLGDALLPRLEARFHDRRGPPTGPDLLRLVRAMTARSRERDQIARPSPRASGSRGGPRHHGAAGGCRPDLARPRRRARQDARGGRHPRSPDPRRSNGHRGRAGRRCRSRPAVRCAGRRLGAHPTTPPREPPGSIRHGPSCSRACRASTSRVMRARSRSRRSRSSSGSTRPPGSSP